MLHLIHGQDGQLAEDRKHVRVEERMAEDIDRGWLFARSQWAIAKPCDQETMLRCKTKHSYVKVRPYLCSTGGLTSCLDFSRGVWDCATLLCTVAAGSFPNVFLMSSFVASISRSRSPTIYNVTLAGKYHLLQKDLSASPGHLLTCSVLPMGNLQKEHA